MKPVTVQEIKIFCAIIIHIFVTLTICTRVLVQRANNIEQLHNYVWYTLKHIAF